MTEQEIAKIKKVLDNIDFHLKKNEYPFSLNDSEYQRFLEAIKIVSDFLFEDKYLLKEVTNSVHSFKDGITLQGIYKDIWYCFKNVSDKEKHKEKIKRVLEHLVHNGHVVYKKAKSGYGKYFAENRYKENEKNELKKESLV